MFCGHKNLNLPQIIITRSKTYLRGNSTVFSELRANLEIFLSSHCGRREKREWLAVKSPVSYFWNTALTSLLLFFDLLDSISPVTILHLPFCLCTIPLPKGAMNWWRFKDYILLSISFILNTELTNCTVSDL